jgi:hypothetical protein
VTTRHLSPVVSDQDEFLTCPIGCESLVESQQVGFANKAKFRNIAQYRLSDSIFILPISMVEKFCDASFFLTSGTISLFIQSKNVITGGEISTLEIRGKFLGYKIATVLSEA